MESKATRGGESGIAKVLFGLAALFSPKLWLHWSHVSGEQLSVHVDVPRCERCASAGPVDQTWVDFDKRSMTIVVHKSFAAEMARLAKTVGRSARQ